MKAAFFGGREHIERVYSRGRREKVAALTELYPHIINAQNFAEHAARLRGLEVIFATWGMPALSEAQIGQLPALRAVFYGAGSVQGFARPLLERDIIVMSAWRANGSAVAEYALAQILLANKGYFRNSRQCVAPETWWSGFRGPGNFGESVALLGAGAIGRRLLELLRPFHLERLVFDPFLSDEDAARLNVQKVSLQEAFARGYVVSNHLANLPATVGMLRGELFAQMRPNATFINTGRGATVDEPALIRVLQERPDLTALLDVTNPEPPAANSPLYRLPNVQLSSHIAGSIGDEVVMMADYCIEDFLSWRNGQPLQHAVSLAMLETMA